MLMNYLYSFLDWVMNRCTSFAEVMDLQSYCLLY